MSQRRVIALTPPERIFAEIGRITTVRMHLTDLSGTSRDVIVRVLGNLTGPLPARQVRVEADQTVEVNVEGDRAAVAIVDSEDGPAPKSLVGRDGAVLDGSEARP